MRILLMLTFIITISTLAHAGLGEYVGRVTIGKQIKKLLMVEVDAICRASTRLISFDYGKDLSPYERARALVYEYSLAIALLDGDSYQVRSLLGKLTKLADDGSLTLTAGVNKIDAGDRKRAAIELVEYIKHLTADYAHLKLDYEDEMLEFTRLMRFLEDHGYNSSSLTSRRNERFRSRKRIAGNLRTALRELNMRDTDSWRVNTQASVTVSSPPIAPEWPNMNPVGLELAASIFELAARTAPDIQNIRENIERILHLGSGADKIKLQFPSADGEIMHEHSAEDPIDALLGRYSD